MASKPSDCLRGYASLLTVLMTLTYHSQVAWAGLERSCLPNARPTAGGVCGANLPLVVSTVCNALRQMSRGGDMAFAKYLVKRSAEKSAGALDESLQNIMLQKKDAFSFLPSKRQIRRQHILCECCYNQCDVVEIAQYCPITRRAPSRRRQRQGRSQNAIGSFGRVSTVEDSFN